MIDAEPACRGDDRFTADDSDPAPLVAICRRCPLIEPCSELARTGNAVPVYGVVGGLVRRGTRSTQLMNARAASRLIGA
ncbi:WhiB family transcriptional regulator [Microbacterium sp. CFBP 8794]|uniref:WhiB family transcriptional regulator n=1 Tax=Microbacterium sp. CFBP 8794 TaxID=2775269 RepID=UPI00177BC5CB|nr:WhiB family transcriptional regulator [Microbacterium sp. CFBP 8794]MBD8479279.1 WhiB family transcriptional regulator [Microbacterium sp. CFBP 8794]